MTDTKMSGINDLKKDLTSILLKSINWTLDKTKIHNNHPGEKQLYLLSPKKVKIKNTVNHTALSQS